MNSSSIFALPGFVRAASLAPFHRDNFSKDSVDISTP